MANAIHHAQKRAKMFGGMPSDYEEIETFLDSSKTFFPSWQHRALLHSGFGIHLAERLFGHSVLNSDGKRIPVRLICENHIKEDMGFVPSAEWWLKNLQPPEDPIARRAMMGGYAKPLSKEVANYETKEVAE